MIEYATYEFFTFNDYIQLLLAISFITLLAIIVTEVIYFIPDFMRSLLRSIKNKKIDEFDDLVDTNKLHEADLTTLDFNWKKDNEK